MERYIGFAAFFCGGMLFLLVIVGVPLAFLAYRRRLKHQETMAMIEKGLLDVSHVNGNGKDTLRWGIVITALGLALAIGLYPLGASLFDGYFPLNFGPWMLIGLIPLFFGLALIVIYLVTREKKFRDGEEDRRIG
jgi:hypothetical protein